MLSALFSRKRKDVEPDLVPESVKAKAASDPLSFGNLAIELGFITPQDLREALAAQDQRLGEVLIQINKITADQRDALVLEQRHRRGEKLKQDEIRKLERYKFRRGMSALTDGFKEAATDARGMASAITALTIKG
ncbi:MAG: hypothetical protein ACTSX8_04830 [Alphaproteobacteria bacterium]